MINQISHLSSTLGKSKQTLCKLILLEEGEKEQERDKLPTSREMFQLFLDLSNQMNRLEEKMNEMSKHIQKQKKINFVEWLNMNIVPDIVFNQLIDKIDILEDDIIFMMENSFSDTLYKIFSRNIFNHENNYPIVAFTNKKNTFYIYTFDKIWIELLDNVLIHILNKLHIKIQNVFSEWKKKYLSQNKMNDQMNILINKTYVKLMKVEFTKISMFNKIKSLMYHNLKRDNN